MGFWDAGTHMSKREWLAACRRVEKRLENLKSELNSKAEPTASSVIGSELGSAAPKSRRAARARTK